MKKSFMTRALATGLSLAMAFSLSAATNVTTAAAAAKPAMKSSKMTIKVGQSKNYQATAATQKSYKISKIKLSAAGKTKVTAKVNSGKKSIKLTGKAATKSTNVVITFKNNKTKKLTKVTTKAVVKEAEKPDEAYAITSAEVTGAKKITVKLNKAVATATSMTAVVKKGTSTKDSSFTVEGSDIVITTDTKLVVGTYSVAIGGLEVSDLTASVEVAKDETLTSYEIGKELIADADSSTNGSIYYKALNQYGEMMTADAPNVTCSFTSETVEVEVTATATREGKLRIKNINTTLAILGTKGTVVLVDQNLGVNTTGEVTYSAAATAAEVKVEGMYNSAKSTFQDITAKDNPASYLLLMTITDQYGHQLDFDDIKNDVGITIAGGITGIESDIVTVNPGDTAKGLRDFSVGEKDYIAAAFKDGSAKKGSATVTVVNNKRGLILTHTIEVVDYVVVANLVLSADDGIYNNQENVISYEATDTNGNAITSYAVLSKIAVPQQATGVQWKWQKNSDGSAKLICKPTLSITPNSSHTASTTITSIFNLNDNTSSDFKVKTQNFTVKQAREVFAVQGLAADTVTQFSSKAGKYKLDFNKIVYADQYANKVTKDDDIYPTIVTGAAVAPSAGTCAALVVTGAGMEATVSGSAFEFESRTKSATATVYLKYYNNISNNGMLPVSADKYDFKFVVTCVDTEGADTASFKIAKVFNGYVEDVNATSKTAITEKDITVTATIGGTDTTLDPSQYTISKVENGSFTTEEINKKIDTKTATVTVQVTAFDNDNIPANVELKADYKISYADSYAYSIEKVSALGKVAMTATSTSSAIEASGDGIKLDAKEMQQLFVFKDQYGTEVTYTGSSDIDTHIAYSITPKETRAVKVYGENGNKVYATADDPGMYLLTITATPANGKSVTKDFYVWFQ